MKSTLETKKLIEIEELPYEYPFFLEVAEWRLKICRKCNYKRKGICPNNSCLLHDMDENLEPRRR